MCQLNPWRQQHSQQQRKVRQWHEYPFPFYDEQQAHFRSGQVRADTPFDVCPNKHFRPWMGIVFKSPPPVFLICRSNPASTFAKLQNVRLRPATTTSVCLCACPFQMIWRFRPAATTFVCFVRPSSPNDLEIKTCRNNLFLCAGLSNESTRP